MQTGINAAQLSFAFAYVQQQVVASTQVFICNRECQQAAHPLHKHYCTQPEYRKYASSLKSTVASNTATNLKYYQLRCEALRDQLSLVQRHMYDNPVGPSRMEQCNEILRTAEQYEDIHLLAKANGIKAALMKQQGKECLLDMMKTSRMRGKAGQVGMALAAPLLMMALLDAAWGLIGKSSAERQQAEQCLQYIKYTLSKFKLEVLAALADSCELAAVGGEGVLERAADYRQEFFAEMIDQNVDVLMHCAVCCKKISGHKASVKDAGLKVKKLKWLVAT